jgi:hypothetical protein
MIARDQLGVAGGLALASVMSVIVLNALPVGAQGEPMRVDLRSADAIHALVDVDDDGRIEMGDRVAVRGPLVEPATGDPRGRSFWDCVAMTRIRFEPPSGRWMCTVLLRLADGDITLQGPDPAGFGASVFAVTGGTGLYQSARGEADVVDAPDPDRTEITINLQP